LLPGIFGGGSFQPHAAALCSRLLAQLPQGFANPLLASGAGARRVDHTASVLLRELFASAASRGHTLYLEGFRAHWYASAKPKHFLAILLGNRKLRQSGDFQVENPQIYFSNLTPAALHYASARSI
jgi:hypothetical protein